MGLLDGLFSGGSGGGYGGLLDALMFQSPLLRPQEVQQPQYDAMGNYTGITPDAPNPFGPIPQANLPQPGSFQPPSVFSQGATPLAGVTSGALVGPQNATPPPQPAMQPPQNGDPLRTMNIGGYQMPQIGSAADYTPTTTTDVSAQSRMPTQQTQPSFLGGQPQSAGFGERLNASAQNFANAGGLLPALVGGVSGLLTGQRTDSQGIAQQNLKAQYDSLVPMLGPQKAMLAVMNPEAGKILLAQALEKRQYGFQKMDDGTLVRTDPLSGKADLAYGSGDANKVGVAGPDGKIIPYPEGLDAAGRKTFANEIARINADAAGGKKTEVQAKSEKFANLMEVAEKNLKGIEGEGLSLTGKALGAIPGGVGNYGQSSNFQKYTQAKNKFITSLLRDESGAAIGTQEFARYERELFPQPGDGPEVVAQKAENRKAAIEAMKKSAGPGYKPPAADAPKVRKYNPVTGTIE